MKERIISNGRRVSKGTRLYLSLLGFITLVATTGVGSTQTNSPVKVGDLFPDLAKYDLQGELPGSLKGKVVIVDFWASWCAPCRRTFPLMEELHHRFANRGLIIVAVNEDKSRAAMDEFLKQYPVTFTVLRDAKKRLAAEIQAPLPSSYVLDRAGKVHSIQPGAVTASRSKDFIKEIAALLEQDFKQP